jgi:hypothetical protein
MKVDLHLVSWHRPKMTELVIKTIHRNTKRDNYRLVVLDNGSSAEQEVMLHQLHDQGYIDELILMGRNLGLEPARSYMLYESTYGPYFICVDNDCLPPPLSPVIPGIREEQTDWTERLVDLMERHPDYGAISCRTQVMVGTGNIFEEADREGYELADFPWPGGSLRIMRTVLTRDIGGWRDAEGRGQEERYISGKLREVGRSTAFATNVRTLHLFGTRGSRGTDRWGYDKAWKPAKSGHNDVSHPALTNGDSYEEVAAYCGEELARRYFDD